MGNFIVIGLFFRGFAGLLGVYAWMVNDMAKGLERQRRHRLALEERLRRKGIIK